MLTARTGRSPRGLGGGSHDGQANEVFEESVVREVVKAAKDLKSFR